MQAGAPRRRAHALLGVTYPQRRAVTPRWALPNVPTCCLNEPKMSVRDTRSPTVGPDGGPPRCARTARTGSRRAPSLPAWIGRRSTGRTVGFRLRSSSRFSRRPSDAVGTRSSGCTRESGASPRSSLRSCSQRFQQLGRLGSIAARDPLVAIPLLVVADESTITGRCVSGTVTMASARRSTRRSRGQTPTPTMGASV